MLIRSARSWQCDETYIKVKGRWTYLYRAVDKQGRTVDFLLSERRDVAAANRSENCVRVLYPGDGKRASRYVSEEVCPRAASLRSAADFTSAARRGSAIRRPGTWPCADFGSAPNQLARGR
jgi:hypothetical protein